MINRETDGFLSICIPTYNRSDRLVVIVRELLSIEHQDFRIVITDNCSTDDTYNQIKSLSDPRIVYIKNDLNIGTYKNLIQAHVNGLSYYNLLLIDKDKFKAKYINLLYSNLLNLESEFEMGRLLYNNSDSTEVFLSNLNSLSDKIIETNVFAHPSGYLFSKNFLSKQHKFFEHLLNMENFEPLWPHNIILLAHINSIKYLQIIMPKDAEPIEPDYFLGLKTNYSNSFRPSFTAYDSNLLIKEFTLHLNILIKLTLSNKIKKLYLTKLTNSFLRKVTIQKKDALIDSLLNNYYGLEPQNFSFIAILKSGAFFIINIDRILNGKYKISYSKLIIQFFYSILFYYSYYYYKKLKTVLKRI